MKAIVFNEELLKRLTGSDKVKVLTEKRHNELLEKIDNLEKKLEIATKALKRIYQPAVGDIYNFETDELDQTKLQDIAYKALKEIEEVK